MHVIAQNCSWFSHCSSFVHHRMLKKIIKEAYLESQATISWKIWNIGDDVVFKSDGGTHFKTLVKNYTFKTISFIRGQSHQLRKRHAIYSPFLVSMNCVTASFSLISNYSAQFAQCGPCFSLISTRRLI